MGIQHVAITMRVGGKKVGEAELLPVILREGVRFVLVEQADGEWMVRLGGGADGDAPDP